MGATASTDRSPKRAGRILLLTGPPGAGKTTVARLIASRWERSAHVEGDRFFSFVVGGYLDPWETDAHEQNTVAVEIACDVAARYAGAGYVTILESVFIPGWFFEVARDRLRADGLDVSAAVIRPSLGTTLARTRDREPPKRLPTDVLEEIWRAFGDLGPLERHLIDNDGETPDGTANRIAGAFEEGSLRV